MKWILFGLMFLFLISAVMAQEMGYSFFVDNAEIYAIDSGLLYVYSPNQSLEDSTLNLGVLFFPKKGFEGNIVLVNEGVPLKATFKTDDNSPNNESYLIFQWSLVLQENTTLNLNVVSQQEIVYSKKLFIEAKKRLLLDKTVREKIILIDDKLPDDVFDLRKRLSTKDIDFTDEEFKSNFENAKELQISKKIETKVLFYEGNLTKTKSKTTFTVPILKNTEYYVIEEINKNVESNASNIKYSLQPEIVEEDPLIVWHLREGNQEISYEIEKQGDHLTDLTGNTILLSRTTEKTTSKIFLKLILPLLLIPIIVILIVYFGTIQYRSNKK